MPKTSNSSAKDFAEIAFNVLKSRFPSSPSNLTVAEVNAVLNNLSALNNEKKATDQIVLLLQSHLIKMAAIEQKWLIRIILKDVKLGMGTKRILSAYHPDAQEMYEVCNDLEKICNTLVDPRDRSKGIEIALFKPFSPMLADRVKMSKILSKMDHKLFYVETKLDGERTQLHKEGNKYGIIICSSLVKLC